MADEARKSAMASEYIVKDLEDALDSVEKDIPKLLVHAGWPVARQVELETLLGDAGEALRDALKVARVSAPARGGEEET